MAGNVQIAIKDRQTAGQWLNMVLAINEDYHTAMKEAGETLTDMQNFADGTLVDDFVNFGTDLLNAAEATFKGIDAIADTVNSVLNAVENFTSNVVEGIGSAITKIFGR